MNYCKSYCEEKGISTSVLSDAQSTLYHIAENMRMSKSISEDGYEHFQQAIKALEQEPCQDCISRKAVLKVIREWWRTVFNADGNPSLCDYILVLPSVTQEWIPCSERLPEEKVEVLVTTEWGSITIAERYSANDYFINDGAACSDGDEITAWMPLPLPWKGE